MQKGMLSKLSHLIVVSMKITTEEGSWSEPDEERSKAFGQEREDSRHL